MPVRDNLGLLNLSKGQGFTKERMDLFQRIIETIQALYDEFEEIVHPEEFSFDFIPKGADRVKTFEKAIEHYAVPNGICIVEDLEGDGYIWIRTAEQYSDYVQAIASLVLSREEQKRLATAAWINGRGLAK